MKKRSLAAAFTAALALAALTPGVAQAAPSSCSFKPVLPGRISIGQSVVGVRVPLTYSNPSCATNFLASTHLVHGGDEQFLSWDDSARVDTMTVYDFEVNPGHYVTTASESDAYDADYNTIPSSLQAAGTIIKFTGRNAISVTRTSGATVKISVSTARYVPFDGFSRAGRLPVSIQQYNPTSKAWQTILHATTNTSGGFSYSHTVRTVASYRVTTAESTSAFGTTSGTARA